MVQTLSLVGAAFAVGGSYFALDSLRDVLIAKTINTPVATRLGIASAAVIGGLFLFGRSEGSAAGQRAKETTKEEIIAKIEAASEQFAAEPDDPNYMVKSDIHKITESGLRMTVLIDEYPDADLPVWLKSKLSVTASEADGVADNMGYAMADPEAFDAEMDDPSDMTCHYCEKDASKRGGLITWPNGLAVCEMCFGEMEERDAETLDAEGRRGSRRDLGRFTRPRKPSVNYYRRKGRRSAISSIFSADSQPVPDWSFEEELAIGAREEMEHTDDPEEAERIAREHLKEDPDYYTKLSVVGLISSPNNPIPALWFSESDIYEAECASCDTTHGFDFMCATCGLCLDCDPCAHDSRARGPFTDKNAESEDSNPYCHLYEKTQRWDDGRYRCGERKGHAGKCSAWSRSGSGKQSFDGYPPCEHIKAGQRDCGCVLGDGVDDSIGARLGNHPLFRKKSAEEFNASQGMTSYDDEPDDHDIVWNEDVFSYGYWEDGQFFKLEGTKFTCDCGAECTVDATTEIAFGPGGYDLRCGRNDDCRGDEKVLGAEVFEAFSLSDRPVSVKFGPGTSGNAKMKAVFTDASGDTKTTQFGYRGMSDYTKHKDSDRRSAYLARHGSKAQGENWKDPTTAGALSRYVLWEKTSLPAAKSAFKKRFNLRAEGDDADTYIGYQTSPFISESDRASIRIYEPIYSEEESL